jgi:hypothetical protein
MRALFVAVFAKGSTAMRHQLLTNIQNYLTAEEQRLLQAEAARSGGPVSADFNLASIGGEDSGFV